MVGTAFDYLARVLVARTINEGKDHCFKMLVAQQGLHHVEKMGAVIGASRARDVQMLYDRSTNCLANYAFRSMGASLGTAIDGCCKLARLEYVARNPHLVVWPGWLEEATGFMLAAEPNPILNDLERLADAFARTFITSGILRADSSIVFHPRFMAPEIGGADADIVIDSVLYDFKTTKTPGYKWQDVAQLWGYFLLAELRGLYDGASIQGELSRSNESIRRLALYKARFGEIEYVDVGQSDSDQTARAVKQLRKYLRSA